MVTTAIQLNNRYLLLSGLGLALIIFMEFLNFENPKELVEAQTGVMNRYALGLFVTDCLESKRDFRIITLKLLDEELIRKKYGNRESKKLFGDVSCQLQDLCKCPVFFPENDLIVIVLQNINREEEVIRKIKEKMQTFWNIRDASIRINTSTIILECPNCSENMDEVLETISYISKKRVTSLERSGDVCRIKDNESSTRKRENTIYDMLVNALENDGFEMYYQPIYSTSKKRFVSAEALVRLKDTDTLGFISPEEFIRVAEERGMIIEIGNIIMEKVCSFIKNGGLGELGIAYIEVNVSGDQAVDEELFERFEKNRKKYGIAQDMINLEITETVAVEAVEMLKDNVRRFLNAGYSFSMDDFGTGYSNISKLMDSFYHLIKFDKSLIWPYFDKESKNGKLLLPNLIKMINELGYQIVAEGIETEEMVQMLSENGVEYIQGYFFSRPVPENAFLDFMKKHQL